MFITLGMHPFGGLIIDGMQRWLQDLVGPICFRHAVQHQVAEAIRSEPPWCAQSNWDSMFRGKPFCMPAIFWTRWETESRITFRREHDIDTIVDLTFRLR